MMPISSASPPRAVVAIPAHDEEDRIRSCLAALAMQRDLEGAPLAAGAFEILVLANNCRDGTADAARSMAAGLPQSLHVVDCLLPPSQAHAGGARRVAMDAAAELIEGRTAIDGVILTTDADSRAQPTWVAASLSGIAAGADAVAGYIDADADEYLALGPAFLARGRLEDRYLSRMAELYARLDPRPHDPWPHHRVHSGAAFAVTLSAYRAIGGLPVHRLGEDRALAEALEDGGFLIRHTVEAAVTTSCRFDSRAPGGAGDTMRARHEDTDASCDADLEPATRLFRRARGRGLARRLHAAGRLGEDGGWARRLGLTACHAAALASEAKHLPFSRFWRRVEAESPALALDQPLRPSALAREIASLERLLLRLNPPRAGGPIDIPAPAGPPPHAIAVPQRR